MHNYDRGVELNKAEKEKIKNNFNWQIQIYFLVLT